VTTGTVTNFEPLIVDLVSRDAVKVPPYPGVAMRLQQLVGGGKYGVAELARLVAEDQTLTAVVLRAANSAATRGVDRITSLSDAVGRIGSDELCRLAIAATVGQAAAKDGPLAQLRRLLWRRALTSAMIAKVVAERRRWVAQEAFVCGLLHDFGWVVAIAAIEDLLARVPNEIARTQAEWLGLLDKFHVELGVVVAARWNLSPLLTAVMSSHHQPQGAGPHRPMVELVALSDIVCALLDQQPSVSVTHLLGVPYLQGPDEIKHLVQVIPQIPATIAAMADLGPGASPTIPPTKSPIAASTTTMKGARVVEIAASWIRPGSVSPARIIMVGTEGLMFFVDERPKENYLMKLRLDLPTGPIEIFASPTLTVQDGKEHRVGAKLFALSGEVKQTWERLLSGR
jgi:HD-like signal output (HDOD) protein